MKKCEKCQIIHIKPGKFCSRSCANSRVWSEETNRKRSESNRKNSTLKWQNFNEDERKERLKPAILGAQIRRNYYSPKKRAVGEFYDGKIKWENLSKSSKRAVLLEEQSYQCLLCGISKWRNENLVLEMDHIDGVNDNNAKSNLRMLCPNCHSQTPTFRGRNLRGSKQDPEHTEKIRKSKLKIRSEQEYLSTILDIKE